MKIPLRVGLFTCALGVLVVLSGCVIDPGRDGRYGRGQGRDRGSDSRGDDRGRGQRDCDGGRRNDDGCRDGRYSGH
jgi:hypothetical protein